MSSFRYLIGCLSSLRIFSLPVLMYLLIKYFSNNNKILILDAKPQNHIVAFGNSFVERGETYWPKFKHMHKHSFIPIPKPKHIPWHKPTPMLTHTYTHSPIHSHIHTHILTQRNESKSNILIFYVRQFLKFFDQKHFFQMFFAVKALSIVS